MPYPLTRLRSLADSDSAINHSICNSDLLNKGMKGNSLHVDVSVAVEHSKQTPVSVKRRAKSPSTQRQLEQKKRFRSLARMHDVMGIDMGGTGGAQRAVGVLNSGRFDALADDVVVKLMEMLILLSSSQRGLELRNRVVDGARALSALLSTCKRMFFIFTSVGAEVSREMTARSISDVEPLDLGRPFPYTAQVELQEKSHQQLALLKETITGMALHCAGDCCTRARKSVCRDYRKRTGSEPLVVPLEQRTTLVSPTVTGDAAFVCSRRRVPRRSLTHSRNLETMTKFVMKDGKSKQVASYTINTEKLGTPQSLKCSPNGRTAAFVRTPLTESSDVQIPHAECYTWHAVEAMENAVENVGQTNAPVRVTPPPAASEVGAINSQETWWLQDGRLALLWSTAYLHPIGTVVGASADRACYLIAVYTVDEAEGGTELDSCVGPFAGKAQMASATRSGDEVAIVVRKPPVGSGPLSLAVRTTILHDVFSEAFSDVQHVVPSHHPHDRVICPSSIAFSPQGDCIVAVHAAHRSTTVEVLLRTAPSVFVSVQSLDVTHWTRIGLAEPDIFLQADAIDTELRLPYSIEFSYCGRFVSILDKRQAHALPVPNHALIIMDTAKRSPCSRMRALPLAPVAEVTPRSLNWTKAGLFVQGFHGAVYLAC